MKSQRRLGVSLLAIVLASACAVEDDVDETVDVDAPESFTEGVMPPVFTVGNGGVLDPTGTGGSGSSGATNPTGGTVNPTGGVLDPGDPVPEVNTTIEIFADAQASGVPVSFTLVPPTAYELELLVPAQQLAAIGGTGAAIRLTCGSRAARVMLYDVANADASFSRWSNAAVADQVDCQPGQQVTHVATVPIRSAHVLGHPWGGPQTEIGFNTFFENEWNATIDDEMPDGASQDGDPVISFRTSSSFRIRQGLVLDHALCFERHGHFVLEVRTGAPDETRVSVIETYVDDDVSVPEPWDCLSRMRKKLKAGAKDAAQSLAEALPPALESFSFGTCRHHYYFAPIVPDTFAILSSGPAIDDTHCD